MGANIVVVGSATLPAVQSVNGSTGNVQLQLSGDVSSPLGSLVSTLATVNGNTGSFGDAAHTITIVLDGKGRATSAASNPISITASQISSGTLSSSLMPAFSGDVSTSAGATVTTLATVNSNIGTFGSTTLIPSITVNAKGLVTGATNNAISLVVPPPIGSTTPNTGAFTTLSASSTVSGAGFSGYLASPPPIGSTTPSTGAFTTISATSTITPSQTNGIAGTNTNNNVNAGSVGEYISSTSSATGLTTATATNLTSISLTAGDWDVDGTIYYAVGTGGTQAGALAGISTTSATLPAIPLYAQLAGLGVPANSAVTAVAPRQRFSLASTTTVYIVGEAIFSGGTCTATGFIRARRVR